ncbi:hypothetical protein [Variovorax sp. ZT4R33]|uniref:hypothetical protein n=1 Tax=Variovorax sp. ZT4R33 TaxID=3443743 RepID=UPI003F445C30
MSGTLRSIAVTVEEPAPGEFVWLLLERHADWVEVDRAPRASAGYAKAMAAGLRALQGLAEDFDAGPRVADAPEPAPTQRAARPFGFGTLR